jgi:hypothetical protein
MVAYNINHRFYEHKQFGISKKLTDRSTPDHLLFFDYLPVTQLGLASSLAW